MAAPPSSSSGTVSPWARRRACPASASSLPRHRIRTRRPFRATSRRPLSHLRRRTAAPERENVKNSAESAFLHRLHKGACGVFGTVLGPEANEAHRDHFHFDLAARKRNAFCE